MIMMWSSSGYKYHGIESATLAILVRYLIFTLDLWGFRVQGNCQQTVINCQNEKCLNSRIWILLLSSFFLVMKTVNQIKDFFVFISIACPLSWIVAMELLTNVVIILVANFTLLTVQCSAAVYYYSSIIYSWETFGQFSWPKLVNNSTHRHVSTFPYDKDRQLTNWLASCWFYLFCSVVCMCVCFSFRMSVGPPLHIHFVLLLQYNSK